MAACCNKLWKMLIDRKMTKTQLCQAAKASTNAAAKMGRDEMLGLMFFAEFEKLSIAVLRILWD